MTHKRWTAKERVDIVVEYLSTNIGVAGICRKHGLSPTTFDNWRKRFMDAGKRELAGIGGNGRSDPAKALAKENESLKIVVGELTLVNTELKKSLESTTTTIEVGARGRPSACPSGCGNINCAASFTYSVALLPLEDSCSGRLEITLARQCSQLSKKYIKNVGRSGSFGTELRNIHPTLYSITSQITRATYGWSGSLYRGLSLIQSRDIGASYKDIGS